MFPAAPPPQYALWQEYCWSVVRSGLAPLLSANGLTEAVTCIDAFSLDPLGRVLGPDESRTRQPAYGFRSVKAFATITDSTLIASLVSVLEDPISYGCKDALCCHSDFAFTLHTAARPLEVTACVQCGHVLLHGAHENDFHRHLSLWGIEALSHIHDQIFPSSSIARDE